MSFRSFKHAILRLSPEEKVIGIGSLLVLVGSFLPWYSIVFNFDKKPVTYSGLSGDLGVIGFVVFILVLFALLVLIGEHIGFRMPQFGYRKDQILLFLMGEGAFLLLLILAVYTKQSFGLTNADIRFGFYISLIGAIFGTFSAFAESQKLKKQEVEELFDHGSGSVYLEEEEVEVDEEPPVKRGFIQPEEIEEEADLFDEYESAPSEEIENESQEEESLDDMMEELETENEETSAYAEVIEEVGVAEEIQINQADYFMKEAELNSEENTKEAETPIEESTAKPDETEDEVQEEPSDEEEPETDKKEKGSRSISMNFYEDE